MRVLVTGAGGMLGSALVPALVKAGHRVEATDLRIEHPAWDGQGPALGFLDVRSRTQIEEWFVRCRPSFVVHLAAETDLEVCEESPEHAFATNALGTRNVALACQVFDVPMTYISSAGVFDGEKPEPYVEYDEPRPINVYAQSKYEGERYVQMLLRRFYIVRAGWMVGGGARDHKFVAKMLKQIEQGARTLYAVGDKLGTPTYAPDFARCFTALMETDGFGIYHMACRGEASRWQVARKILDILGYDEIELVEVDSEFFRDRYPVRRPRSEMMRNLVLELQGMNTMRSWEASLEEYLLTEFAHVRNRAGIPLEARA